MYIYILKIQNILLVFFLIQEVYRMSSKMSRCQSNWKSILHRCQALLVVCFYSCFRRRSGALPPPSPIPHWGSGVGAAQKEKKESKASPSTTPHSSTAYTQVNDIPYIVKCTTKTLNSRITRDCQRLKPVLTNPVPLQDIPPPITINHHCCVRRSDIPAHSSGTCRKRL